MPRFDPAASARPSRRNSSGMYRRPTMYWGCAHRARASLRSGTRRRGGITPPVGVRRRAVPSKCCWSSSVRSACACSRATGSRKRRRSCRSNNCAASKPGTVGLPNLGVRVRCVTSTTTRRGRRAWGGRRDAAQRGRGTTSRPSTARCAGAADGSGPSTSASSTGRLLLIGIARRHVRRGGFTLSARNRGSLNDDPAVACSPCRGPTSA